MRFLEKILIGRNNFSTARLSVEIDSGGTPGIVVRAASGQVSNLLDLQNFSGTSLLSVDKDGNLAVPSIANVTSITGSTGNLTITAGTGNNRTMTLQTTTSGGAAQTNITLNADQSVTIPTTLACNLVQTAAIYSGGHWADGFVNGLTNDGVFLSSSKLLGWSADGVAYSTKDTILSRSDTSTLKLSSDGSSGAANLIVTGITTTAGRKIATSIKTTTYSMTTADDVVVGNHATVAFTISLLAVSGNTGVRQTIKNKGAAIVTVDVTGGGSNIFTSSAVSSVALNAGDSITVVNDGALWLVI